MDGEDLHGLGVGLEAAGAILVLTVAVGIGDAAAQPCGQRRRPEAVGGRRRVEQLAHVASCVVDWHRLSRADRGYCSLPLFHVNAEVVGLLATLRAGAYLAVDRKFSRRGFWDLISAKRITWINAVPAIISILSTVPPADPLPRHIQPLTDLLKRIGARATQAEAHTQHLFFFGDER